MVNALPMRVRRPPLSQSAQAGGKHWVVLRRGRGVALSDNSKRRLFLVVSLAGDLELVREVRKDRALFPPNNEEGRGKVANTVIELLICTRCWVLNALSYLIYNALRFLHLPLRSSLYLLPLSPHLLERLTDLQGPRIRGPMPLDPCVAQPMGGMRRGRRDQGPYTASPASRADPGPAALLSRWLTP